MDFLPYLCNRKRKQQKNTKQDGTVKPQNLYLYPVHI